MSLSVWTFFREFAAHPTRVGAVAPSGSALARRMVDAAAIRPADVVVEVGAGTGPMTRVLVERYPDNPLLVLEPNGELAAVLRLALPEVEVMEALADDLPRLIAAWGQEGVDRIVSGLPWAIWPEEVQVPILDAMVEVLRPEGRMVTFTYVHSQVLPAAVRFKGMLDRYFTTVERTGTAWWNVPPAFAFVCHGPKKPS